MRITPEGGLAMSASEHMTTRSQDLEEAWHDCGQFYWGRSAARVEGKPIFGAGTTAGAAERRIRLDVPFPWSPKRPRD